MSVLIIPIIAHAFDPGAPYRIGENLQVNEFSPLDFKLMPDGKTVVYTAISENGETDLFTVSVRGGNAKNLTIGQPGRVGRFVVSEDSLKIVYETFSSDGSLSLWGIERGELRRLSGFQPESRPLAITQFEISSDSSQVVYLATTSDPFRAARLFGARLDTTEILEPIRLGIQPVELGGYGAFKFIPGQNRVVCIGKLVNPDQQQLYVVQPDVPNDIRIISVPLLSNQDVLSDFDISPDSEFVVYRADAKTSGTEELYSSRLSFPTVFNKLNPNNLVSNEDVTGFNISPDSSTVIYRSDERVNDVFELFSVPINDNGGNNAVNISGGLMQGQDVSQYSISPNSQKVAFTITVAGTGKLYSTNISDSAVTLLTPDLDGEADRINYFSFSRSGARVIYHDSRELRSVRVGGGGQVTLSPQQLPRDVIFTGFFVDRQLDRVFYLADQDVGRKKFELFSSLVDGPSSSTIKLSTPLQPSSSRSVGSFLVSPAGDFLVYAINQSSSPFLFELYAVNLDESDICIPIKASNGNVAVVCL